MLQHLIDFEKLANCASKSDLFFFANKKVSQILTLDAFTRVMCVVAVIDKSEISKERET
ncbi:hypothetical protein P781_13835 [Vibrio mimicus CAIM 1883]|nr:hypothetical protein P780_13815 [Vibrio mimicus CAIM 1882]ERM54406.1 hypothetical protein P781_13835 [Vibrio mimicus CAIM 1883]